MKKSVSSRSDVLRTTVATISHNSSFIDSNLLNIAHNLKKIFAIEPNKLMSKGYFDMIWLIKCDVIHTTTATQQT